MQPSEEELKVKMAILIPLLFLVLRSSVAEQAIAKPNCLERCGEVDIPYPFGTTQDCYHNYSFLVTCNQTSEPPKLFVQNSTIDILSISLDGQLRILQYIAKDCYVRYTNGTTTRTFTTSSLTLADQITVNNTGNKFIIVGCDAFGFVSGSGKKAREYKTGCSALCYDVRDLENGSCSGIGCCQTNIPKQVWRAKMTLESYNNYSLLKDIDTCSYGFIAEETSFSFSPVNLTNLKTVEKFPMVADWVIDFGTCGDAILNSSSYACKSKNSECKEADLVYRNGYRCYCKSGYRGNPYLIHGCQDIDECNDPKLNICDKQQFCRNTDGNFTCVCPKGYHGDGRKDGKGCTRGDTTIYKLVTGISFGGVILLLSASLLNLELKRRSLYKEQQHNFTRNGGKLLLEKLSKLELVVKLYSFSELQKATNNFNDQDNKVGQGGFSTVYRCSLPNKTKVAIKKYYKQVDEKQLDQFVNEVILLCQSNHRNVVKLFGCCLQAETPLLVFEFISNGTLSEHIHIPEKARCFDWYKRLRIATETAEVLSYFHFSASPRIVHRDIKPENILLDEDLTVKVSDFGLSKLVAEGESHVATMVIGTKGFLDPEYAKTNKLTDKVDVYGFGVVLVELLTGRKAVNSDNKPELEESEDLATIFLSKLKKGLLSEILDANISPQENISRIEQVAGLAKRCLHEEGDHRPTMKEVSKELEGLI